MKAAKQEDLTKVKFSVSQLRDEIASLKSEVDTVRRQSAEDVNLGIEKASMTLLKRLTKSGTCT